MKPLAVDTSVAIPLLVQTHTAHDEVVAWWNGASLALCGHALAETYSVLTRLPGDIRLDPTDAAHLIDERFETAFTLDSATSAALAERLSRLGISGGAVYDAMIGLAAVENDVLLGTRDGRALAAYEAVGARTVVVS